jgi:hypothetical protein
MKGEDQKQRRTYTGVHVRNAFLYTLTGIGQDANILILMHE